MKKYKLYLPVILLACTVGFTSCSSNDAMTELNTDPSKAATIDANAQLTTAELQLYGDLDASATVRSYLYAFTQQLMGCWNTTNYGGRHTQDDNEMGHTWRDLYPHAVRDLVDAESRTHNDKSKLNINAALRVYRAYIMSILTDIYGDVPYFQAGQGYISKNPAPKFDKQKDIYTDLFAQLDTAQTQFAVGTDKITGDLIYSGNISKWQKLVNSLRMRWAMRISDVAPDQAKKEFIKAVNDANGYMTTTDDDALIKYISGKFSFGSDAYNDYRMNRISQLLFGNDPSNNPSFMCSTFFNELKNSGDPRTYRICRFYCDDLMSATMPDNRIDLTHEILTQNITPAPRDPGAYAWEPWPSGYTSDTLTILKKKNNLIDPGRAYNVEPKLATNFLQPDNPGTVMTSAEVKFLMAEAQLKGWNVSAETAEQLYDEGVRLSMDYLSKNYGCAPVSDAELQAFLAGNDFGHTAEKQKEAINTQAWILHFTNPYEGWANLRRSGYPKLKSPADYGFTMINGHDIPVRLCYPVLESSYNKANYEDAVSRQPGGVDSWNNRVWWDVK
ncbi:MAG: SusD/RagB family nutrient-binding outer membrane lipoprotein [Prevotella sp.]|jgi:hypothetical protein|nr:SusD/RagB family nutrient-binding outer membrane lipoprotein [Prevotella sp.]MCH4211661.1 SusD/RagB family nutrient-binding outer membrane lipoprotein [Prevotella sp.]MCH4240889.1 SusD/RagB family nutrient-binding outer membrane lipoprotein [Prevotella sp.]